MPLRQAPHQPSATPQSGCHHQAFPRPGGGNHFAELQMVDEVLDAKAFKLFGLGKQQLVVLVHSGSRGLGESILRDYVAEHQARGSGPESFSPPPSPPPHDPPFPSPKPQPSPI